MSKDPWDHIDDAYVEATTALKYMESLSEDAPDLGDLDQARAALRRADDDLLMARTRLEIEQEGEGG